MKNILYVSLGGGIGSLLRYAVTNFFSGPLSVALLFVNIAGSLLIGFFTGLFRNKKLNETQTLLLSTGFCGGFTTFSAFAGESYRMYEQSNGFMLFYLLISASLGMLAVCFGLNIGSAKRRVEK